GGKLSFGIPETTFSQDKIFSILVVDFDLTGTICNGGPDPMASPPKCTAEVNLAGTTFKIDAITPSSIQLSATLPIQLDDTPVKPDITPGPAFTLHVGYGSNGACVGPKQERASVQPKNLPVKITIPLVAETTAPRTGYTKVDVDNAVVDLSAVSGN